MSLSPDIVDMTREDSVQGAPGAPEERGTTPETAPAPTGARVDWFPTSIWRFNVAGYEALNKNLMQFIEDERRRDPAGMSRSVVLGWHSTDQLHRRPELREFVAILDRKSTRLNSSHLGNSYAVFCW